MIWIQPTRGYYAPAATSFLTESPCMPGKYRAYGSGWYNSPRYRQVSGYFLKQLFCPPNSSYLTIAQWFGADQNPPHLKAIAPWEGQTDAYRETILQGGIANVAFPRQAVSVMIPAGPL